LYYNHPMNERFRCTIQAADMCDYLAETLVFIAKVNKELGNIRKAEKRLDKAIHWKLNAEAYRQEAEQY
jgi:hypothetical protein